MSDNAVAYIRESLASRHTHGDGQFTERCHKWLKENCGVAHALLTTSCSSALDMCALLCAVGPGDEVILPSFTFSSTANAFLLRGAKLCFVEVTHDTLNLDPEAVAEAVTEKTKVIVPVHYAGVACDMERLVQIAEDCDAMVVEDAAQGIEARWQGRALGSIGHLGALSFHGTKNVSCGEGGALLINDERFIERAQIVREKGTNRFQFLSGEVEKYTWVDIGSSYLLSDLSAALLLSQLERAKAITERRLEVYERYMELLSDFGKNGSFQLPHIPEDCQGNGHIFYLLVRDRKSRDELIAYLREREMYATFHYIPLHNSPMGFELGYRVGDLPMTESLADRLIRLPIGSDMDMSEVDRVCEAVSQWCEQA